MKKLLPLVFTALLSLITLFTSGQEVKVMSFNIRVGVDGGNQAWGSRSGTVAGVVQAHAPDFMGVQEALPNQTADLDGLLSDYSQFGRGREASGGGEGSQIFYRHDDWTLDPNENGTFQLSPTPDVWGSNGWNFGWVRICTWGRFIHKTTGQAVYMYNTHYPLSGDGRSKCTELIVDYIQNRLNPQDPVVVTGDLNAGEEEYSVTYFKGQHGSPVTLNDSYRVLYPNDNLVGTFSGWGGGPIGGAKIDYVLAMGYQQVTSAEIVYPQNGEVVSDHFPVVGTFIFNGGGAYASIELSQQATITEGQEDGTVITVTLSGDEFVGSLNSTSFSMSNLPDGVTMGAVNRISATVANITLVGNATVGSYAGAITDVGVSIAGDQFVEADNNASASTGLTFSPAPIPIPGKVEAEAYSAMNGIQTEQTTDTGGGDNVGWIDAGDWLEYEVDAATTATYDVIFRTAGQDATGAFNFLVDGVSAGSFNSPATGGWQTWQDVSGEIDLSEGEHTIRLEFTAAGMNFNYMEFSEQSNTNPDPDPSGDEFSVSILSMNLWRAGSGDWSGNRRFNCQAQIEGEQPDVVGIQEGDEGKGEELAGMLADYTQEKGPWNDGATNFYYNHTTTEVIETGTFGFSSSPDDPNVRDWGDGAIYGWLRICNWMLVKDKSSNGYYYVYNTHMDPNGFAPDAASWRRQEAELILSRINSRTHQNYPFVLMGDLNGVEGESFHQYLVGQDGSNPIPLVDTYREILPNGPGDSFGGVKYDYIMVEDAADVVTTSAKIIYQSDYGYTSDHNQVAATIAFNSDGSVDPDPDLQGPGYDTTATGGRLFVDHDNVDLTMEGFGGSNWSEVDNPDVSGINTSARVGQTAKGVETWAGIFNVTTLTTKVDFSATSIFKMKVRGPVAGEVLVKFENSANKEMEFYELSATTTKVDEWEEITIDFSDAPDNVYDRLVLFFDYGSTATDTWYYDEVALEKPAVDCHGDVGGTAYYDECEVCVGGNTGIPENSCVITVAEEQQIKGFDVYPNPSSSFIYLTGLEQALYIYDASGRLVFTLSGNVKQINVSSWNSGIYLLRTGSATRRILVK